MAFIPDVRKEDEIRKTRERLSSVTDQKSRSQKIEEENRRNLLHAQFAESLRERAELRDQGREHCGSHVQESDQDQEIYPSKEITSSHEPLSNEEEIERITKLKRLFTGPKLWRSVLVLSTNFGEEMIKKARGRLLLKVHPDKNNREIADQAGEAITMVLEAYDGLTAMF